MNNTQKLQVATDALERVYLKALSLYLSQADMTRAEELKSDVLGVFAILRTPSTEQQAVTANGLPGKRKSDYSDVREPGYTEGWNACLDVVRIAQAAPAGDAVAAIVDRAIPPMTARVVDHDINGKPIYSNDPFIGAERAATQPAGEVRSVEEVACMGFDTFRILQGMAPHTYTAEQIADAIAPAEKCAMRLCRRSDMHAAGCTTYDPVRKADEYSESPAVPSGSTEQPALTDNRLSYTIYKERGDAAGMLEAKSRLALEGVSVIDGPDGATDFDVEQPAAASVEGPDAGSIRFHDKLEHDKFIAEVSAWGAQQREAGRREGQQGVYLAMSENDNDFRRLAEAAEKERDDLRAKLEQATTAKFAAVQNGAQLARPTDLAGLTPVFWFDDGGTFSVSANGLCSVTAFKDGPRGKHNKPLYSGADVQALLAGKA